MDLEQLKLDAVSHIGDVVGTSNGSRSLVSSDQPILKPMPDRFRGYY